MKFTTIVALDREHLPEFHLAYATWQQFRPEIIENPLLIVADLSIRPDDVEIRREVQWLVNPFTHRDWPQRERQLAGLVYAPRFVQTPYYLKLDTDCVATSPALWYSPEWFDDSPAFVASPWRYTKPADAIQRLDDWGDHVPVLKEFPRLNIPFQPGAASVPHRRIISYCFWGNTEWSICMSKLINWTAGGRLPVPSQDTFHWYCAARRRDHIRRVRMANWGWSHVHPSRLRKVCLEILCRNETPQKSH